MGIGLVEIILILILLGLFVMLIFTAIYFLAKYLNASGGGKICPHCAERIQKAAKVCRYCQRDVANVELENKPPRGLFQ
jgi:predicted amidophosphoribosyltransferase